MSPSFSAAISEVSGGTAALTACWFLLLTLFRLGDSPGDHQCETWRSVSHRHSETQETAVRTPPTMTVTNDHSTLPSPRWMPLTLPPQPHLTNTSHGNQWCIYKLTKTTAEDRKRSNPRVCLMIKKEEHLPVSWGGMEKLQHVYWCC